MTSALGQPTLQIEGDEEPLVEDMTSKRKDWVYRGTNEHQISKVPCAPHCRCVVCQHHMSTLTTAFNSSDGSSGNSRISSGHARFARFIPTPRSVGST